MDPLHDLLLSVWNVVAPSHLYYERIELHRLVSLPIRTGTRHCAWLRRFQQEVVRSLVPLRDWTRLTSQDVDTVIRALSELRVMLYTTFPDGLPSHKRTLRTLLDEWSDRRQRSVTSLDFRERIRNLRGRNDTRYGRRDSLTSSDPPRRSPPRIRREQELY